QLAVGEDPLLADLHAADAAGEPRGAGDDVGHARASDATGRRRTALDGAASIGVEPEARGRGTVDMGAPPAIIVAPSQMRRGARTRMPSAARTNFDANKGDIDRLWKIHSDVAGGGPGR